LVPVPYQTIEFWSQYHIIQSSLVPVPYHTIEFGPSTISYNRVWSQYHIIQSSLVPVPYHTHEKGYILALVLVGTARPLPLHVVIDEQTRGAVAVILDAAVTYPLCAHQG